MSRNNKNAKRIAAAREMSSVRKGGGSGPKKTTPLHGKKKAWFQLFDTHSEYIASLKKAPRKQNARAEVASDDAPVAA
jgi:hypothetical protein